MKKQYMALLAAFAITLCMAAGMLLVSGSALMNRNGVPVADSPAVATATAQARTAEQAQIQQLQNMVTEYQTRETKYQNELQSAGQDLQRANNQMQQYQQLLMALQNRGYINIEPNGQITIR
jgi:peptidoglycan hydrolase CwlO-like protein